MPRRSGCRSGKKDRGDQKGMAWADSKPFAANKMNLILVRCEYFFNFRGWHRNCGPLPACVSRVRKYKTIQGGPMFEKSVFQNRNQGTAEQRLWRAVIARTLEEWMNGPLRYSRIAEEFLFYDDKDFPSVCSSAGMDPLNLREKLRSMRARVLKQASDPTPAPGSASSRQRIPQSLVQYLS